VSEITEVSELIKHLLEEKQMTQTELSRLTGITQSSLSDYINGKYKPKQDKIDAIAKALGVSPAMFFRRLVVQEDSPEHQIKSDKLPVIGTIAAGVPLLAEQNIEDYFLVDPRLHADYIIRVKGTSMINAGILDGDYAFIRQQPTVENGDIAAVLIDGDSATLKRVYHENGIVRLVSENPAIPTKIYDRGDVRVLGRLVAVLNVR